MLAARYAGSFVIFSPSFDRPFHESFDRQGETLRQAAPRHLITQHPNTPYRSSGNETAERYYDRPYLGFSMNQTGHNEGDREIVMRNCIEWNERLWSRPNPKPVVNGEAFYDAGGLTDGLRLARKYRGTAFDARAAAYLSWFSGALGYTYGAYGLWNWGAAAGDIGFEAAMRFASSEQMRYLALLLGQYAWWKLQPAADAVASHPPEWTKRIALAAASDRSFAMAYLPDNERISLQAGLLPGRIKAVFFNPRSGNFERAGQPEEAAGRLTYARPGDGDWVLILESGESRLSPTRSPER